MLPSLARISQLQDWRGRKPVEPTIAGTVASLAADATRTQRRLGELADLWLELVPPEIVENTALAGLRSGVLHVTADSSATSFQLDRLLRGGLETELRQRFRGTLVRIRVRVEAPADSEARDRQPPRRTDAQGRNAGRSSNAKARQFGRSRGDWSGSGGDGPGRGERGTQRGSRSRRS